MSECGLYAESDTLFVGELQILLACTDIEENNIRFVVLDASVLRRLSKCCLGAWCVGRLNRIYVFYEDFQCIHSISRVVHSFIVRRVYGALRDSTREF